MTVDKPALEVISAQHDQDERFEAMKVLLGQQLGNPGPRQGRAHQPFGLRSFLYDRGGDGIAFLREPSLSRTGLIDQWEQLRSLLCDRPLLPRLIIAASGFDAQLEAGRRHDLVAVLRSAREPWCHWLGMINLERLSEAAQPQLIDLFASLGVQVYLADEPQANPLPVRCQRCRSARADVFTIGRLALCTSCRGFVDTRRLISDLFEFHVREAPPVPDDAF